MGVPASAADADHRADSTAETQSAVKERRPPSKSRRSTSMNCLLMSSNLRLRLRMKVAASSAGWGVYECTNVRDAVRAAVLHRAPLALVDIRDQSSDAEAFDDLIRVVRSTADSLIVICDQEATPEKELWSRQNGAWLYLPGVDEESDLARICREAKAIAEKLRGKSLAGATA